MFEALTLGVFQAGISWKIVFGKRDALRKAFRGFDVERVATMTDRDVDRLVQDPSIIRSRARPGHHRQRPLPEVSVADPAGTRGALSGPPARRHLARRRPCRPSSPHAEAFAKQLKAQGYRFVGPTSMYAFMQNVGMVNDHIHGCFRAADYSQPPAES